ncbi:MAG: TolC family protein [Balneolaceae bacterium]|nr:TolC family protein [Balneolaceae bacterium]
MNKIHLPPFDPGKSSLGKAAATSLCRTTATSLRRAAVACLLAMLIGLAYLPGNASAQRTSDTSQHSAALPDSLQFSGEINLTQALQIALSNNTSVKRALLSIRDADQQIRSAWSNVLPTVAGSMNYTRNLEVPVNFIPEVVFDPEGDPNTLVPVAFGTDNNWSGGFSVSQTLFNGQAFVGISSSELVKASQSENLRATAQGVVTQTRIAYYDLLIAKQQLAMQQTRVERIRANLRDTRSRYEQGFVDRYAVTQLEVQLSNQEPQLTNARFAVEDARRNLLDQMGLPVHLDLTVRGDLNSFDIRTTQASSAENQALKRIDRLTPLAEADSTFLQGAMEFRGDMRILDVRQELQQKQITAQKSQYLPTLSASYNLQWSAAQSGSPAFFGSSEQRARSQTLMINLQVPLFQGFSRDAAITRSQIQLRDLRLQEQQARRDARKEIISARQNIENAMQTAQARARALEQAREGYERARQRYDSGLGSQQEVTDAELQLREAETGYAQMVYSYLAAKAQYDQAIGRVPFVQQNIESIRDDIRMEPAAER